MKRIFSLAMVAGYLLVGISANAKPPFLKKARELGLPGIDNCMACHISTEPGNARWNERGLWLKARKQELNAETVDVTWLKDYKPAS